MAPSTAGSRSDTTSEILALTPAYTHVDHRLSKTLGQLGIKHLPHYECSDLPKARSQLLTYGLEQTDAGMFLLLDSDMTPSAEQLLALLTPPLGKAHAVSAAYVSRSGALACRPLDLTAEVAIGEPGRAELDAAGLGCMAIHRASLERVAATLPRLEGHWLPFCVPFYDESGRYYADDYSLCARLRATGTRLWLATDVLVPHLIREPRVALPGRVTPAAAPGKA